MTAIVAANFDWSIESCDKAPHDLNYERNTEKYGRAMKLTIGHGHRFSDHIRLLTGLPFYVDTFCLQESINNHLLMGHV